MATTLEHVRDAPAGADLMRYTYDPEADVLTVWYPPEGRATAQELQPTPTLTVELDDRGAVVRIDQHQASAFHPRERLERHEAPDELLSLQEAARRAGVRPNALRMQIGKGKLQATKHGWDWVVRLADLLTWEINKDPRGRKPAQRRGRRKAKAIR